MLTQNRTHGFKFIECTQLRLIEVSVLAVFRSKKEVFSGEKMHLGLSLQERIVYNIN